MTTSQAFIAAATGQTFIDKITEVVALARQNKYISINGPLINGVAQGNESLATREKPVESISFGVHFRSGSVKSDVSIAMTSQGFTAVYSGQGNDYTATLPSLNDTAAALRAHINQLDKTYNLKLSQARRQPATPKAAPASTGKPA
ncbi:MAG: hypothetical protein GC136_06600 [Alphaproteobacteria bacterium]|nr:hypothetical protein [Alphaproteobacteria bacterium]